MSRFGALIKFMKESHRAKCPDKPIKIRISLNNASKNNTESKLLKKIIIGELQ